MEIVFDKSTNVDGKITIHLNKEDYHEKVENEIKTYSKKAQIKGFRPGKVPFGYIKKLHGKSFYIKIVSNLIEEKIQEYIKNNKIKIVGVPIPDETNNKIFETNTWEALTFAFSLGFVDFEKINIEKAVTVVKYEIKVDDKKVEESIKQIQKQFTTHESQDIIDEKTEIKGKISYGDKTFETNYFSPSILGKEASTDWNGKKKNEVVSIKISKSKKKELLRKMLGENIDVDTFPLEMEIEIEDIGIPKVPELDNEFFKKLYPQDEIKDLTAFKEKISDELKSSYSHETNQFFEGLLVKEYIEKVKMEFPEEFYKHLLKLKSEKVDDAYLKENFDKHLKSAKWEFLIEAILEKTNDSVTKEHVEIKTKDHIIQQYKNYNMLDKIDEETLDKMVEQHLYQEEGKNFNLVYSDLRKEKAVVYIKSNAKIKEKTVTMEKYQEILKKNIE